MTARSYHETLRLLRSVESKAVRQLVRGLLAADASETDLTLLFDRLFAIASPSDLQLATSLLSAAQIDKRLVLSLPFPPLTPELTHLQTYNGQHHTNVRSILEHRLLHYTPALLAHLQAVRTLNHMVSTFDFTGIRSLLDRLVYNFGYSVHVTRKVLSLNSLFYEHVGLQGAVAPYIDRMRSRRRLIERAIEDSFDSARDYITTRRTFFQLSGGTRLNRTSRGILRHHFSPLPETSDDWFNRAIAHASYSVFDLLMFVLESKHFAQPGTTLDRLSVPEVLHEAYEASRTSNLAGVLVTATAAPPRTWLLYRHSIAWLSDLEFATFYVPVESYLGTRLNGTFSNNGDFQVPHSYSPNDIEGTYEPRAPGHPLVPPDSLVGAVWPGVSSGAFQRTLLTVKLIDGGNSFDSFSGTRLLRLLNFTTEVAQLLSPLELDSAFPPKPEDRLYELLRTSLMFSARESLLSDYAFRTSVEDLTINDFSHDIVDLFKFIYNRAPEVAAYYFDTWNEHFLVQCYRLFKSAYEVNEARASILDWYGHATSDDVLVERARSLRLENKLTLIRHDIDSQRLYVDLVRFKQWMNETVADTLRSIATSPIPQEAPESETALVDELEALVRPELELAVVLNTSFREFCCNKAYGVDSYIGRRIRHGTFSGTLYKGLTDLAEELLSQLGASRPHFEADLRNWLRRTDEEVQRFAKERLQINTAQKPRGLVYPHIGTASRIRTIEYVLQDLRPRLIDRQSIPEALDIISQVSIRGRSVCDLDRSSYIPYQ